MTERERDEDGQFSEAVDDGDLLDAVAEHAPASTSEVAQAVGLTRQAVDYRLRQLDERGAVENKKIGPSLVWTDTQSGEAASSEAGQPPQPPAESAPEDPDPAPAPVAGLDLEGSGSRLDARRDALRAIVDHLREEGSASAGELKQIASEFDHGYTDADAFWSNMRRQNALDALPVETPGRGGKEYRYQG